MLIIATGPHKSQAHGPARGRCEDGGTSYCEHDFRSRVTGESWYNESLKRICAPDCAGDAVGDKTRNAAALHQPMAT